MRKVCRWMALAVAVGCVSRPSVARAEFAEMVTKAGSKVTEWLGFSAVDLAEMAVLAENVRKMLANSNEALAMSRQAYRAAEYVRTYSSDMLRRDSETALFDAFPELRDLQYEAQLMDRNVDGVESGLFMRITDYHDHSARERAMRAVHALRSAMWPKKYGSVEQQAVAVDLLVQKRFESTGMEQRRAMRNSVLEGLADHSDNLYQASLGGKDMNLEAAAITAKTNTQISRDISETLDLQHQQVAKEEKRKAANEALLGAILRSFENNVDYLWGSQVP